MIEILSTEPTLMDKIRQISDHYDKYTQTRKTREECQELMDELFEPKIINGNYVLPDNTWSEVADVIIMCIQLAMQHGKENTVKAQLEYKVGRQLERIENEIHSIMERRQRQHGKHHFGA